VRSVGRLLRIAVVAATSLSPASTLAQSEPPETGTLPVPGEATRSSKDDSAPILSDAPSASTPDSANPAPPEAASPPVEKPVVKKRIVHRKKRRRARPPVEPEEPVLPPPPPPVPTTAPIGPHSVTGILGKKVASAKGDDLGHVVDVLVNEQGEVRAVVIDLGGFLGVGNRKIAVDWSLLQFKPDDNQSPVVLHLSRQQIQKAPEFKDGAHPMAVLMLPSWPSVSAPTGAPLQAPATAVPTPAPAGPTAAPAPAPAAAPPASAPAPASNPAAAAPAAISGATPANAPAPTGAATPPKPSPPATGKP
jgi:hypothetical protein